MIHAFLITCAVLAAIWIFPLIVHFFVALSKVLFASEAFWKFVGKMTFFGILFGLIVAFVPSQISFQLCCVILLIYWLFSWGIRDARKQAMIKDFVDCVENDRSLEEHLKRWEPNHDRQIQRYDNLFQKGPKKIPWAIVAMKPWAIATILVIGTFIMMLASKPKATSTEPEATSTKSAPYITNSGRWIPPERVEASGQK
jgi:hypothetical protein